MENFHPENVYPPLFNVFNRTQAIPLAILQEFMVRSMPVKFKQREVIIDGKLPSTYGYFIISGLIMCYLSRDDVNYVQCI